MTEQDFIDAVQFKPWENRGDTLEAMDCYGLVKLYYQHVHNLELPHVTGYKEGQRFDKLWRKEIEKTWRQVGTFEVGAMVTFYGADNNPAHVGICISDGKVLHARGTVESGGKVEIHSIHTLSSVYNIVTFHKLIAHA